MSFAKNGHPGGKLTWITLQRMVQLVWYIWCKVAKKISQFAPRTNLSTVVGDAENEGERNKKKDSLSWQHCAAFLLSCGFISTPRNQIHDGSRDWNVRCKGVGLILVNLSRGGLQKYAVIAQVSCWTSCHHGEVSAEEPRNTEKKTIWKQHHYLEEPMTKKETMT